MPCLLAFASPSTAAAEFVVGLGAETDTADSTALSAFGSVAIAEQTWLSGAAASSRHRGSGTDLDTVYFDAGLDHWFDPVGLRAGAAYWGDADLLDSVDGRVALYWKNDAASLSIDYERRAFDLTLALPLSRQVRTVEFDANGIGAHARVKAGERLNLYAGGMHYTYSRDIGVQPGVDVLRVFALSRLSMANSLVDDRINAGIEWSFGPRMLDVRVSSWRTAVFHDRVDALEIGLLTPIGNASDVEFRVSRDDSDAFGSATVFSVFLYFYGT